MTIKFSNITKMFDGRILYSDATFSIKSHASCNSPSIFPATQLRAKPGPILDANS